MGRIRRIAVCTPSTRLRGGGTRRRFFLTFALIAVLASVVTLIASQMSSSAAGNYTVKTWDGSGLDIRPKTLPDELKGKDLAAITQSPLSIRDAKLTSGSDYFKINDYLPDNNNVGHEKREPASVSNIQKFDLAGSETKNLNKSYTLTWKNKGFDSQGYPIDIVMTDTVLSVTNEKDTPFTGIEMAASMSQQSIENDPKSPYNFMIGEGYFSMTDQGMAPYINIKHKIVLKLQRADGSPASGNYLFAMKDLDILDQRYAWWDSWVPSGVPNNDVVQQSDKDEMTTLLDGFDSNVYVPSEKSFIDKKSAATGLFRPAAVPGETPEFRSDQTTAPNDHLGYMDGTDQENFTTGFLAVGKASGMTFEMQGTGCATGLFTSLGNGYLQTATKTPGGTISPDTKDSKTSVTWGSTPHVISTAGDGYVIDHVSVNGQDVPEAAGQKTYDVTLPPTELDKTQTVYVWFKTAPKEPEQPGNPGIDVKKSFTVKGHEDDTNYKVKAGDVIDYKAVITNTSKVTLNNVKVDDDLLGVSGQKVADKLEAGKSVEVSLGSHTVTDDDVKAGKIDNTVKATGTPEGSDTPISDTDTVTTPAGDGTPAMAVRKTYTVKGHEDDAKYVAHSGDVINYIVTVTNTGDVVLDQVKVTDELLKIKDRLVADTLDVGQSAQMTGSYTVTEADVEAGKVDNVATATAIPANGGDPLNGEAKVSTPTGRFAVASDTIAQTGDGMASIVAIASTLAVIVIAGIAITRHVRR